MQKGTGAAVACTALVAALAVGGTAIARGSHDGEGHLSGAQADRAAAAALEITGGGTANAVERDSASGATWEVEVTRPDGSVVDVRLDDRFELVVIDSDSEPSR